jgi:adenylyltransferase/sulfurtransferase
MLCTEERDPDAALVTVDVWNGCFRTVQTGERTPDCPTCGRREFEFLDQVDGQTASLCGRRAVQVSPARAGTPFDMDAATVKLTRVGVVHRTPYLLRCRLNEEPDLEMTVFTDGRLLVSGTTDSQRAKSLYARYLGS